jgi:uncharacterized protein
MISIHESLSRPQLRQGAQPVIAEATRRLVQEFDPEEIWLFGSYAWGEPNADSDLDLLVVVDESDQSPARRMQRAHRCLRGLGMAKDVLVHTLCERNEARLQPSSLFYKIEQEGVKLHG